jgi:hypothetical protein
MKNNSFILIKEEKERIKKLYEATAAASSGAYNQPLMTDVPVETIDIETTFIDGDNLVDDSMEMNLDVEELFSLLNMTEEEELERLREMHSKNVVVKEQIFAYNPSMQVPKVCLDCVKKALGPKLSSEAESLAFEMYKILLDGEVSEKEMMEMLSKVLSTMDNVDYLSIPMIATQLWNCRNKCGDIEK